MAVVITMGMPFWNVWNTSKLVENMHVTGKLFVYRHRGRDC